jgi:ParB family chromosome partitioning protein
MSSARHGLGKGLEALLPEAEERTEVAVQEIHANPDQPRKRFIEKELAELAYSIRIHGLLQPLVVAPRDAGGFELIAGERRLRASKIAGLRNVPVFVRTVDEQSHYELALIENLQRSDLSPVEEAKAYAKLIADFNLTQDALAKRLGKSRSKIAGLLRLLNLSAEMQAALEQGQISVGHASALLGHEDTARDQLFALITAQNWSVRQAERWQPGRTAKAKPEQPHWVRELEQRLGTKVEQRGNAAKGRVIIHYDSAEQLNQLVERLHRSQD